MGNCLSSNATEAIPLGDGERRTDDTEAEPEEHAAVKIVDSRPEKTEPQKAVKASSQYRCMPTPILLLSNVNVTTTVKQPKDLYLNICVMDGEKMTLSKKTSIKKNTLSATWEEGDLPKFEFTPGFVLPGKTLLLQLFAKQTLMFDTFLGQATVALGEEGLGKDCKGSVGIVESVCTNVKCPLTPKPSASGSEEAITLCEPPQTGTLDLQLLFKGGSYMEKERPAPTLEVFNMSATGLVEADLLGKSDPYVVIRLLKPADEVDAKKKNRLVYTCKTSYQKKTVDPKWTEHIKDFRLKAGDTITGYELQLEVWDHDKITADDFLGFASVVLGSDEAPSAEKDTILKLDLKPRKGKSSVKGALKFTLKFKQSSENAKPHSIGVASNIYPAKEQSRMRPPVPYFSVSNVSCADLHAADINGSSDPYVRITLYDGMQICTVQNSKTLKKTLAPDWQGEEFLKFGLTRGSSLIGKWMHVQVWDSDLLSTDDFLGEIWLEVGGEFVKDGKANRLTMALLPRQRPHTSHKPVDTHVQGEISLTVMCESSQWVALNRPPPILAITSIKCTNLVDADIIGASDPYVKVQAVAGNPSAKKPNILFKYATEKQVDELNPEWSLSKKNFPGFKFWNLCPGERLLDKTVSLQVWDQDTFFDDFLGQGLLAFKSDGHDNQAPAEEATVVTSQEREQVVEFKLAGRAGKNDSQVTKKQSVMTLKLTYHEQKWTENDVIRRTREPSDWDTIVGEYVYEDDPNMVGRITEDGRFICAKGHMDWTLKVARTIWDEKLLCSATVKKTSGISKSDYLGNGHGGRPFDHSETGLLDIGEGRTRISELVLSFNPYRLVGLGVRYSNGKEHFAGAFQNEDTAVESISFPLHEGEHIGRVVIVADEVIEGIQLFTNTGRNTQIVGNHSGRSRELYFPNNEIIGFFGTGNSQRLDSLGVLYQEKDAGNVDISGTAKELVLRKDEVFAGSMSGDCRSFNHSLTGLFCPKDSQQPLLSPGMSPPVLTRVHIFATDAVICGLKVVYSNDKEAIAGDIETGTEDILTLQTGEYIASVVARGRKVIESIRLVTNTGRKKNLGKQARNENHAYSKSFSAPAGFEVIGFYGSYSDGPVESLGVIYRKIELSRPLPDPSVNSDGVHDDELFDLFRVNDSPDLDVSRGTVNVITLKNADLYNGMWIREDTNGLQLDENDVTTSTAITFAPERVTFPEKFRQYSFPGTLRPKRTYGQIRTSGWSTKQFVQKYTLPAPKSASSPAYWQVWLAVPPVTSRATDFRLNVDVDGQSLQPATFLCRDHDRLGEKALFVPVAASQSGQNVTVTYEWKETTTSLVCVLDNNMSGAGGQTVGHLENLAEVQYQDTKLVSEDRSRYTKANFLYSFQNEEVASFVEERIWKNNRPWAPESDRFHAVDVAWQVCTYMAEYMLLATERDQNESRRMGPYATHKNFPYLLTLIRAEAGTAKDHAILFVGLMRSMGIPARRLCLLDGAQGWAEYHYPGAGWQPVLTTDKEPGLQKFGTAVPPLVTGFGDGYCINDVVEPADAKVALMRVLLTPTWIRSPDPQLHAELGQSEVKNVAAFTVEQTVDMAKPAGPGDWGMLNPQSYSVTDLLADPLPIEVPRAPAGAITADDKRLRDEFTHFNFKEVVSHFINLLAAGKFDAASSMMAPQLEVEMREQWETRQQENRAIFASLPLQRQEEESQKTPLVVFIEQAFIEANQPHLAKTWPVPENKIILSESSKWKEEPILNVGNIAKTIRVPVLVNDSGMLFEFEFVHSRGKRIFDLLVTNDPEFLRARSNAANPNKRAR